METLTYYSGLKSFTDDVTFSAKDRNLIGRNGKPLRLYNRDGKPVTDFDGEPLLSITGRVLLVFNRKTFRLEDVSGYPLEDCWGRSPSNLRFNPEEGTDVDPSVGPLVRKTGQPRIIFDLFGFPLTDSHGRPLVNSSGKYLLTFDSKGEPVCDSEGRLVIECPSYFNNKNAERFYESSTGLPLQIFDAFKRPLTNKEGFPLLDIMGESLVRTDAQNSPIKTSYGSDIYDCKGRSSSHPNYNPTEKCSQWELLPPILDDNGNAFILFDQTGFPLTDDSGLPLIDSHGCSLLKYDNKRGIISKSDFDILQLSANNYNPCFLRSNCNEAGKPARFFNFQGKPLTNWLGEPLKHADGCITLKYDIQGSPKCDFQGLPIYDEFGQPKPQSNFSPYESCDLNEDFPRETDALQNGIRLYDGSGMPVTDHRGFHLKNASRKFMIKRDSKGVPMCDYQGGPLYTECGLPLVLSIDEPLLDPKRNVCRLFDHNGYPLTNSNGIPLKLLNGDCITKIDKIGRIIGNWLGKSVYDRDGVPMTFSTKFNASKAPKKISKTLLKYYYQLKNTKQLFSRSGFPMTDPEGEPLTDCLGMSLINLDLVNKCVVDVTGHEVYENVGCVFRPDKRRFGCIDSAQAPDKKTCLEQGTLKAELIVTDENHKVFDQWRNAPGNVILFEGCHKIFDRFSFPLLDRFGAILETSEGELVLKFDECGRLLSDYRGYDVYDKDGIPLTNVTGAWRDRTGTPLRLFTQLGLPLTDSLGRTLHHIKGYGLLSRDDVGRPLLDYNFHLVYDAQGTPSNNSSFNPKRQPDSGHLCPLLDLDEKPLRVYNSKGWPLNDENGLPLMNNKKTCLITGNHLGLESIKDSLGNRVYDGKGVPFGCHQQLPLLTMSGMPFRLYNCSGQPLTDFAGVPLKSASDHCLIVFDMFGRPFQDAEGGSIFDRNGWPLGSPECRPESERFVKKQPVKTQEVTNPTDIFPCRGKPLLDSLENDLTNYNDDGLVTTEFSVPESTVPESSIDGRFFLHELGNDIVPSTNTYILLIGK